MLATKRPANGTYAETTVIAWTYPFCNKMARERSEQSNRLQALRALAGASASGDSALMSAKATLGSVPEAQIDD
jgi:hypothetical protein